MSKLTPCNTATRLWALLIRTPYRSSELLHGGSDPIRIEDLSLAGLAGLREKDEADARGGSLLVALKGVEDRVHPDRAVEGDRQAAPAQQLLDLGGQRRRLGEAQRRKQAEPDRLAVPVARVAAGGLDRVPDRVPQVEDVSQTLVSLVGGHYRALVA